MITCNNIVLIFWKKGLPWWRKNLMLTFLRKKLAKLLDDSNLGEIEYEKGDERIRLSRGNPFVNTQPSFPPPVAPASTTNITIEPAVQRTGGIPSPMVGTAYLSSQPGSAPLVTVGDRVNKGQTILIIEAMKVMNPIPAPQAGIVKSILVTDGQPVEFGQILITIT